MKKMYFFLLMIAGLTAVLAACGDDTPPQIATVAELCDLPAKTLVQVEGNLNLPSFLTCQEGECTINFGKDGSGVLAKVRARDEPSKNMMQYPPEQYTLDDLIVVLDDGTRVTGRNTAVLATGRVGSSGGSCHLDIHTIQQP